MRYENENHRLAQYALTETEYQVCRALYLDDYTVSGIMAKTGLSFVKVRAAVLRTKSERAEEKVSA